MLTDHDHSFTEASTPRGPIRKITSAADAGTATVTVRCGPGAAFTAACRALAGSATQAG